MYKYISTWSSIKMEFHITLCRVAVFRPGLLQWICREWVQKLGFDEATTCFGDGKHIESTAQHPREEGSLTQGRESPTPLASQKPLSFLWASFFLAVLLFWVISIVIYSSLPFIPLLHLSVIHAYPWVHVPSTTLSGALWVAVAPTALSRGHIHINRVRVLAVSI